jgi:hypothetical protein
MKFSKDELKTIGANLGSTCCMMLMMGDSASKISETPYFKLWLRFLKRDPECMAQFNRWVKE